MFKILLPVDFSDSSDNACHYALALAGKISNTELFLLHCFYDYLADADQTLRPTQSMIASEAITQRVLYRNESEARQQLDQLYHSLLGQARASGLHLHLQQSFLHGVAEEIIPQQIKRFQPDLVIMGTKGTSGLARSLFGTITTQVVKQARVPVLTVPQHYKAYNMSRALYATDFDKADIAAITALARLLEPFKASILCVHIAEDGRKEDRRQLQNLQLHLQSNTPAQSIRYTLLEGDDVAEALLETIRREQVDLIALTSRGREGTFESLFHPSLAKKMVLKARVPLLIFHGRNAP